MSRSACVDTAAVVGVVGSLKLPAPIEKLPIIYYPHAILRKVCDPVDSFDTQLTALANRMLHLMHEAPGVGLAAPQVGVPIRMFVCNPTGEPDDDSVWVNPRFVELVGSAEAEEGCLSLPGVSVLKRRAARAVIVAKTLSGQDIRAEATDLRARIWQHEADHLDGVLVIDGMTESAKLANRRAIRQLEESSAST